MTVCSETLCSEYLGMDVYLGRQIELEFYHTHGEEVFLFASPSTHCLQQSGKPRQ